MSTLAPPTAKPPRPHILHLVGVGDNRIGTVGDNARAAIVDRSQNASAHLCQFVGHLRAACYGSFEVGASSPDVTLATLRFRKGARFVYEYDLNIPWRHEVRIEDRLSPEARKTYPVCTRGGGACPPEDCGGPESFMVRRDDRFSFDALEDLDTMVEVLQQVALKDGSEPLVALDQETCWRLEDALERAKARDEAQGRPFSRREVNASLRDGEHHNLMHQQW
jgi:hypothetical protein